MSKQLWFTNVAAATHRGDNSAKLAGATSWWSPLVLAEARGLSATTATAASIAGTTVGIEFTSGSVALEWISEPLSADFTIAGTITGNLWGFESTMNDNTALNFVVDKIDGATGAVTQIAKSARVIELATSPAAVNNFTVTPASTACKRGDRIRVRPFIDDAGAAMVVGTTTFSYNGPTGAAAGDSWIQFTENLTFELAGDPGQLVGGTVTAFAPLARFAATNIALAQAFLARGTQLTSVSMQINKQGSPTDDVILEIQSDTAGVPSGTVVAAVATVAGTSITGTQSFTWTPGISGLVIGTRYHLVIRRSGGVDGVNYCQIPYADTNFDGTAARTNNGSSWSGSLSGGLGLSLFFPDSVSTYYLTDTAETINPGSATEKKALTTRGSGSANAVTNTAAGPTAGIQATASGGGTAIEWYTPPLNAFTLGGKTKFNIRGLESNAAANASLRCEIAVVNTAGTSPVVWGSACIESDASGGELGTADAAEIAWVAGDDLAVTADQRLRFRVYVEDVSIGPLVTGHTVTISYNGSTAAAAGDTYVILPQIVTESGPTTWTGAATVQLTDTRTSNGTRKTFAVAVISEADIRQTGGVRTTTSVAAVALVTNLSTAGAVTAGAKLGSATIAAVATVTTAGTRTARTGLSVVLTNSRTAAGTRKTTSASAVALVANRTTVGRRTTLTTATVSLVANRITNSRLTAKAATATSELVTVTTIAALAGDKIGSTSTTLNLAITTVGRRTTRSASSTSQTVTVTTLGRRTRLAAITVAETVARTTNSRVGIRSSSTIPIAVSVITSTRKVWLSTSTVVLAIVVTSRGARLKYGTATIGEAVQINTGSRWQLNDGASVQLVASVFSSATTLTPLPGAPISQTEDGLFSLTASGSYSHTGSGNINDHQEGTLVGTTTGRIIG